MAFVPAVNVVQAELLFNWDGQQVENVLHYQIQQTPTLTDMSELGGFLVTWWQTNMQPLQVDTVQFNEVRMTDLTSEFAPGTSYTTGLPDVGAAGPDSVPNNVTLSMTKRTGLRGRAFRGRIYQIGLRKVFVDDNQVIGGTQTSLLDAWNLATPFALTSGSAPMVVVSRFEGGSERLSALVTPVTVITTDGIIDSQRRRLPGRGS